MNSASVGTAYSLSNERHKRAEAAIDHIMRRAIQGTHSHKGLQNQSVLRSLVETAKRQGKKVHLFLLDLPKTLVTPKPKRLSAEILRPTHQNSRSPTTRRDNQVDWYWSTQPMTEY